VVFFSKALVSVFDCLSKLQPSPLHLAGQLWSRNFVCRILG